MSEIITDKLTGKASAGSVTITTEGNTVTQSLQAGLIKTFCGFNQHSSLTNFTVGPLSSTAETLNISSFTDVSTGKVDVTFTNNFTNADRPILGQTKNTNNLCCPHADVVLTSKVRNTNTDADSSAAQDNLSWLILAGSLA